MKRALAIAIGALVAVAGALWVGLRIKPNSFSPYPEDTPQPERVPLPTDLPEPVARFYHVTIGERVPVISSAVLTGSGPLRIAGVTFNGRFRFTHRAGQDYRHYIEATVFGYPVFKVNERYLDGISRMELPVGTTENEPTVNQGANLGLWGESIWLPSVFITDPRVRWEPINATTAQLVVPFEAGEDSFTVTFDADTGLIRTMEAMRYKDVDGPKIRWIIEPREWTRFHDMLLPSVGAVTWEDEGTPWAIFEIEDVAYNVDVDAYLRARGL